MARTIQDVFMAERQSWLESARATAVNILKTKPIITIEDVLKECPLPPYLHRNTIGQVFNSKEFAPVGWRRSARPAMNGRHVRTWRRQNAAEVEISDTPIDLNKIPF